VQTHFNSSAFLQQLAPSVYLFAQCSRFHIPVSVPPPIRGSRSMSNSSDFEGPGPNFAQALFQARFGFLLIAGMVDLPTLSAGSVAVHQQIVSSLASHQNIYNR